MRIKAGDEYVRYIYDVLNETTPVQKHFENYEFRLFQSYDKMLQLMREKEKAVGLCRQGSGYAWKWDSKNTPDKPDMQFEHTGIWWNSQTKGWVHNLSKKEEMGSIYTLHGLDLNYACVIIGPELYYDTADNSIKVNKANFFDNKVKKNCTDEELKRFILNTYGVLFTRGIWGTYVYVCDQNLRTYLQKYIPIY